MGKRIATVIVDDLNVIGGCLFVYFSLHLF